MKQHRLKFSTSFSQSKFLECLHGHKTGERRVKQADAKAIFLPSELYILTQVGTPATKTSPVVHLNILKVSCFMMEVAKMRPNSQNGEEWSLTHQKGGI